MSYNKKLFGVALDPADDPWSLELKRAWMTRTMEGTGDKIGDYLDPYDAVTGGLTKILDNRKIQLAGKFPVPSWLWPKPMPADFPQVTTQNTGDFYDSGDLLVKIRQLQRFVEKEIFPATPVMVGVDHSATMGVISALAQKYGPEKLSVIAIDQHFDAIALSVRMAETAGVTANPGESMPLALSGILAGHKDQCCCGNFWAYLIDEGSVLPRNLSLIGVADYPGGLSQSGNSLFKKSYLSFEEKGCGFFTLERFQGDYLASLTEFIDERITTPYAYVSLDLDVGSYNCTLAARYMDRPGISAQNLLDIAAQIRNTCRKKGLKLAGFDIMEFNMHFLGIETDDGVKDSTLSLAGDFINTLTE